MMLALRPLSYLAPLTYSLMGEAQGVWGIPMPLTDAEITAPIPEIFLPEAVPS